MSISMKCGFMGDYRRRRTFELTGPRRYRVASPDHACCESRFPWLRSNDLFDGAPTSPEANVQTGAALHAVNEPRELFATQPGNPLSYIAVRNCQPVARRNRNDPR